MSKTKLRKPTLSDDDPLIAIADVMKAYKGDWKSPDAITVVRSTNNSPVNKIFTMGDDGEIVKKSRGSISDAIGVVVGVPDVHALATLLELVGEEPSVCLISGRFPLAPGQEGPVSDPFRILSKGTATEAADVTLDEQGWGKVDGFRVTTRSLETTAPTTWVLLDCDFVPGMPDELRFTDYEGQWWPAMVDAFPGLEGAGRVHVPSSTSRLLDDRGEVVFPETPSSHTWVQVDDPSHTEELRSFTLYAAARAGKAFMRFNKAGAGQLWTIFDPSTFSRERLVFDGAPSTKIEDYTIADPDITVFDGGRFDTRAIPPITTEQYGEIASRFNIRFEKVGGGSNTPPRAVEYGLCADLELVLRDMRDMKLAGREANPVTLAELHASLAHLTNPAVRCQTPFRDSDSWAATVYLGSDRLPFINDFGSVHIYRMKPGEVAKFPEKPYAEALRKAVLGGNEEQAQNCAATYSAVLTARGMNVKTVNSRITSIVKKCLQDDPNCFLPDYNTKDRNSVVLGDVTKTVDATVYRINASPGGSLFDLPTLDQVIDEMNEEYIHAVLAKKARVIREISIRDPETKVRQYQAEWLESGVLKEHLGHEVRMIHVPGKKNPVAINPFQAWLKHEARNTAVGVEFRPEPTFRKPDKAMQQGGTYNLWQGFLFEPSDDPELEEHADLIEAHFLEVIAAGDKTKFDWIMDWIASLVQKPQSQGLCIPVWKSQEGAGKNTPWDLILAPLLGWHAFEVGKLEDITGRFNSMFGFSVLVVGNEALWGGDRAEMGPIKTLIDTKRRVELKFAEAFMSPNYCKVLLFTNEDWYAPENLDGRRFVPFDVSPHRIRDEAYFARLREACELGRAAFLTRLLARDINWRWLRTPPGWASESGLKNKLAGESAFTNWLHHLCLTGRVQVPERKLTKGTFNVVRVADVKIKGDGGTVAEQSELEKIPHLLGDRLIGSAPDDRNGEVEIELGDDGVRVSSDVLYQSYLHYASTARKPHRFAGNTMEPAEFGSAMSKLADKGGLPVVRRKRLRTKRLDRFAGYNSNLRDYEYSDRFYIYEMAPLKGFREAFQGLSRLDIIWGATDRELFSDEESDADENGYDADHDWGGSAAG